MRVVALVISCNFYWVPMNLPKLMVAVAAVCMAGSAGADVRFTRSPVYLPTGSAGTWSAYGASPGTPGLLESAYQISRLGPISNGRLARSHLVFPELDYFDRSTVLDTDPSRVLSLGRQVVGATGYDTLVLHTSGNSAPLFRLQQQGLAGEFMAVTRYGSDSDMDIVFANVVGGMSMRRTSAPEQSAWFIPSNSTTPKALKRIPASANSPTRVALLTTSALRVVDAATGALFWQPAASGAEELAVADLTGDGLPDLVTSSSSGDVRAYTLSPPGTLWTKSLQTHGAFMAVGDHDGNGVADVLVQNRHELRWYNGATGNDTGLSKALPLGVFSSLRVLTADVAGDSQQEVISIVEGGDAPGIYVHDRSLQNRLLYEQRQYTASPEFRLGDVDADGQQEVVTLGKPDGASYASLIRIGNVANGAEEWVGFSSTFTTPLMSGDQFIDFDLAQLDADPAQEIVLLGSHPQAPQVLAVFDGASRARQRREVLALPGTQLLAGLRTVPTAPGSANDLLVIGGWYNNGFGLNVFLLDATSLVPRWTLSLPGFDFTLRHLEVRQMDADPALEAVIGTGNGIHVVDLQTGQSQRDIPVQAHAYAVQELPGGRRLLAAGFSGLTSFDAATGAVLDRFALPGEFAIMTFDPSDPDRLFLGLATRRIHALRLSTAREEGRSDLVMPAYGNFMALRATLRFHEGRLLLGDMSGVQAFDLATTEPSLFADGFESPLFYRLPLQTP